MDKYLQSLNKIGEMLYGRDIWAAMVQSAADLKEENKERAATAPPEERPKAVCGDDAQ